MCDVMDHFRYNRNVVSKVLRFVDQYVGHLLTEDSRSLRPSGGGASSARGSGTSTGEPIKRRHFQLIAVTLLYLTTKVHGEFIEDNPVFGATYNIVQSLVHKVGGCAFLGKLLLPDVRPDAQDTKYAKNLEDHDDVAASKESNNNLQVVSHKITNLKCHHRRGCYGIHRLVQIGLPPPWRTSSRSRLPPCKTARGWRRRRPAPRS